VPIVLVGVGPARDQVIRIDRATPAGNGAAQAAQPVA
jgi:hypothetical protein